VLYFILSTAVMSTHSS